MHREYTGKAARALDFAEKISQKMHHNYIGTEHILMGFFRAGRI